MSSTAQRSRSSTTGLAGSWLWALTWLLGTAAICWVAATQFAPRVEDRILSGIQSVLSPLTPATPVIASVHGRDATLTGRVTNNQQRANLLSAVEGVPGVRSVVDQLTLLEPASVTDPASATDKGNTGDTTRDTGASESADDATTLTVIDSSSSESSSDSAIPLTGALSSTANQASTVATTTIEAINTDAEANATELALDSDSAPDTDSDAASDADTSEDAGPPESDVAENTSDNMSIATVESDDQSSLDTESASLRTPSLDFNIEGKTLAVSGRLSNNDDAAPLIRTAMVAFDLDYISNTIELSDDVEKAPWLDSVSEFLPDMTGLENPSIEINEDEIQLGGNAPDTETQDAVLGAAMSLLGDYTMSEDIALTDSSLPLPNESANNNKQTSTASNETMDVANDESDTDASNDAISDIDTKSPSDQEASTDSDASDSDANNTSTSTTEDSDAIGDTSEPADINVDASPSVASVDSLSNAFNDLPSMDILFESSSDILTIDSLDVLDSIANVLVAHPGIPVRIEGHTDASGAQQDNLILSQLRANSVRDYLVDRGVSIYRLKAYGFGEGVPISDNGTPDGRADNRRIEFNFQR